jgi:UDP-N-acetylmuramate--alanine ligase
MEDNRLSRIYRKTQEYLTDPEEPYLVQSIEEQALFVCKKETVVERYNASTSRFGCGIRENSFKTPPGIHRIRYKIGAGAPEGRVFRERIDSGINWDGQSIEDNLILTRIMWLEGMEEGINKGLGVDSHETLYLYTWYQQEDLVELLCPWMYCPTKRGCCSRL